MKSNPSNSILSNASCVPIPFPGRFKESKKYEDEKSILETFKKVQVNHTTFGCYQASSQVCQVSQRSYALLGDRIREKEVVKVSENVSAVIQRKMPPKCKDPGSFNYSMYYW